MKSIKKCNEFRFFFNLFLKSFICLFFHNISFFNSCALTRVFTLYRISLKHTILLVNFSPFVIV